MHFNSIQPISQTLKTQNSTQAKRHGVESEQTRICGVTVHAFTAARLSSRCLFYYLLFARLQSHLWRQSWRRNLEALDRRLCFGSLSCSVSALLVSSWRLTLHVYINIMSASRESVTYVASAKSRSGDAFLFYFSFIVLSRKAGDLKEG